MDAENFKKESNAKGVFPETKILSSYTLFEGKREIIIEHNKIFYRLMITKAGKLILNK
jgi:hemin uptake protein HemP